MQINVESFDKICRTCLSEESLLPINGSFLQNGLSVVEALGDFVNVVDLQNTQLPQQICTVCFNHLNSYHNLKTKCFQTETLLKTTLATYLEQIGLWETKIPHLLESHVYTSSDDDVPLISRKKIEPDKCKKLKTKAHRANVGHVYSCKQCDKSFQFRYRLVYHMRVHTKEKPYKCDECSLSFSLSCNLKRHKKIHTGEKPHICTICGKAFIQPGSLQLHLKKHQSKPTGSNFFCQICNRLFIRRVPFNLHLKKYHPTEPLADEKQQPDIKCKEEAKYKCAVCGKTFLRINSLKNHELRHGTKKFLCNECGKGFVSKGDLHSHLKIHTGEKPHQCNICHKSFAHAGSLVIHNLMHSGYKPYSCEHCNKSFSQKSHLKVHQRTHSGERPYFCSFCGKNFALKSNLTVHVRIHTGEMPYICTVCGRGFYDSSSLKKHRSSHLDAADKNEMKLDET